MPKKRVNFPRRIDKTVSWSAIFPLSSSCRSSEWTGEGAEDIVESPITGQFLFCLKSCVSSVKEQYGHILEESLTVTSDRDNRF